MSFMPKTGPTPAEAAMATIKARVEKYGSDPIELDEHLQRVEAQIEALLAAGLTIARPLNEKTVRAVLRGALNEVKIARVHSAYASYKEFMWREHGAT